MSDRPDAYIAAVSALRTIESQEGRAGFTQGSDALAALGEEAVPGLALAARELAFWVAALTDRDVADVYDDLIVKEIGAAEGMDDDDQSG